MSSTYSDPHFYFPYIIACFILYSCIQLAIWVLGEKETHNYLDLDSDEMALIKDEEFIKKGKDLGKKYMCAFLLAKAAMWAKSPYNYMLFSTIYNFSIQQIGVLYILDALVGLITGPFLGNLADTVGRKRIASLYPLNNIISTSLRLSGIVPLAYTAQVFTGMSGGILATAFESWLNFEIEKIYGENKNYIKHYKKHIFSTINFYDSIISIAVTIVGTTLYNLFGIYIALGFSIFLSFCCFIVIQLTWAESTGTQVNRPSFFTSMREGISELKCPQVLCLGLIDAVYQCSIQLYIFFWTPVLQMTAHDKFINPGMIFVVSMLILLSQNKILELMNKTIHPNYFVLNSIYCVLHLSNFAMVYYFDNFTTRMIILSCINGSSGFWGPVISYLRSVILPEKSRTLLMTLFRVPLNMISITLIILTGFFNPFFTCLIVSFLLLLPLAASLYLLYFYYKNKGDKRVIKLDADQ